MLNSILFVAENIGIIAFAVSGAMLGAQKNLDIFGIIVLGIVTALGGGVIRDLLLGITPPAMFTNYVAVTLAVLSSCLIFLIYRFMHRLKISGRVDYHALVNFFDAIGLGVFSVSGVNVAIDAGYADTPLLAITVGVITGIGGGMIRDLLSSEIPSVLHKNVYALPAILGASLYYVLAILQINSLLAVLAAFSLIFGLRMAATYFRWQLPRPQPVYKDYYKNNHKYLHKRHK